MVPQACRNSGRSLESSSPAPEIAENQYCAKEHKRGQDASYGLPSLRDTLRPTKYVNMSPGEALCDCIGL